MSAVRTMPRTPADFREPRWAWLLFHDARAAWLWLAVRLAWRNAGWIGLDRWLLPAIGTPWEPGRAFRRDDQPLPTPERG
jgi:hypothetical protein